MKRMYAACQNLNFCGFPISDEDAKDKLLKQIEMQYPDGFSVIQIKQTNMKTKFNRRTDIVFEIN